MSFDVLFEFESALAEYTGAPYVVLTDGCTHALELCFRYDGIRQTTFTPYTYLSIPMLMNQLHIKFDYYSDQFPHRQHWTGEYKFELTRIWDSARRLERNMYRKNALQCLSFGNGKPLQLGKVGAILTDDVRAYNALSCMRSDGRDLHIEPWQTQTVFKQGYHYCPTLENCQRGVEMLDQVNQKPKYHQYPDLRKLTHV
jgi:hypothetical protein